MGKKRIVKKGGDTDAAKRGVSSRAPRRRLDVGVLYVEATYNNTKVSLSDTIGNIVLWSSSGSLGFSGAKKATPFAAARVAEAVVEKVKKIGVQDVAVRVSGVGSGRDSAVRALANHGLNIISIKDITPIPHNGPRAKKVRRV